MKLKCHSLPPLFRQRDKKAASMAEHWRHKTGGRADIMRGEAGTGYFTGWAVSAAATLTAIFLVVHFAV
jgi:hypothetical protein